jgi:hypothetical protein
LNPSPIRKVLSIFRKHRVRALLMGGQACVVYGAAEFSRDVDLAVLANDKNLSRLQQALDELKAEAVEVPPLEREALLRGHACHFRAGVPGVKGLRIDIMSALRGCGTFAELWRRRNTLSLQGLGRVNLLSLEDLVQAKKTQRDKDWPMIVRLVEADYQARTTRPPRAKVEFWLREARTAELLAELCRRYPKAAKQLAMERPAVKEALLGKSDRVEAALQAEESAERAADKAYWAPLRVELSAWRHEQVSRRSMHH